MIAVWNALEKGVQPGPEYIRNRMKDYVRKLNRESRQPDKDGVQYDDESSHTPSAYSERERLSRASTDLDTA